MAAIDALLRTMLEKGGSDLHLTVGLPPKSRISGSLTPIGEKPLTAQDMEALLKEITPEKRWKEFLEKKDLDLAHEVVALLEDAVDAGAFLAARLFVVPLEDLFQPLHLLLGLLEMLLQAALELAIGGLLDHRRQRFHDLVLRIVDVVKAVLVEVLERPDLLGKHSHRFLLVA